MFFSFGTGGLGKGCCEHPPLKQVFHDSSPGSHCFMEAWLA